jgi:hypothetical protein
MNTLSRVAHKTLYWTYISLFFLTPLIFYPFTKYFPFPWKVFSVDPFTYELFEFNKMFFVYGIAILVGSAWAIRCITLQKIIFKRTFVDYALVAFLLSQVLSTLFSIDLHTSLWGYYSRFHGGLFSTLAYLLLYWGFVSNLGEKKYVHSMLVASLSSATLVSWYGIAQHFGVDSNYWVQNVRARVFSTLGQPNWLAAYLVALLPVSLSYFLYEKKVSDLTGNDPANPWNPEDAFMAAGIYLKDSGASKQTVKAERYAALCYLAGCKNATKKSYQFYADDVMELADRYQKQIDILNKN